MYNIYLKIEYETVYLYILHQAIQLLLHCTYKLKLHSLGMSLFSLPGIFFY